MAIEDYIPNFFGGNMPSYLPGLLGEEESAALQKRANVQGLLGAALTLAQGMSPSGPRRSAAQNILSALAGGFQAGQGAYQGAAQNILTQQEIAKAALERQKAMQMAELQKRLATENPELANLLMLSPSEGAKLYGEQIQAKSLEKFRPDMGIPSPQPKPAMPIAGTPLIISDGIDQFLATRDTPISDTGEAQTYPVQMPTFASGEEPPVQPTTERILAPVTVEGKANPIGQKLDGLLAQRDYLQKYKANLIMNAPATSAVAKKIEEIDKGIEQFTKQISVASAASMDLDNLKKFAPPEFAGRVAALETAIYNESLGSKEAYDAVASLQKDITEFATKRADYTNEVRRVAAELFPNKRLDELNSGDLAKLNAELDARDIAKRKAGATTIALPSESERTAGYLTTRLRNSLENMQQVLGQNPQSSKPGFIGEAIKSITGSDYLKNIATPEARQRVEAAQLDILDAALTLGTGAAYTTEQLEGYRKSYFPQLGDGPQTIKDKQKRLEQLLEAANIKAGRAAPGPMGGSVSSAIEEELQRRKQRGK